MQAMLPGCLLIVIVLVSLVHAGALSPSEHASFEARVKHADTILFGRFNWAIPVSADGDAQLIHDVRQNVFEFVVYCTIKKIRAPDNVLRVIHVAIEHYGDDEHLNARTVSLKCHVYFRDRD